MTVALSVVVPVKDEADNVATLAREIASAMGGDSSVEIIFVDDGSADETLPRLLRLKNELPSLRVVRHTRNGGQSRALRSGVRAAKAGVIVTLDGDGQNDPADISKVLAPFHAESGAPRIGMVSGVRTRRRDSLSKRIASVLANRLRRSLLDDGAADVGCGLKAFQREAYLALPYFDHMHRYLAALMLREGYEVRFVDVGHRPRLHGRSKYGVWDRFLVGVQDIFGVLWLKKRYCGAVEAMEL
ncbi:MAG TPA: glycosyltransferase family 2 protein [Rhizomicrobium sp.]|jgi:dolichol-phosphate mannosyltransferase